MSAERDLFGVELPAVAKVRPLAAAARAFVGAKVAPSFNDGDTYRIAEVRAVVVREDPAPVTLRTMFDPGAVVAFWHEVVERAPWFDGEKECVALFILDRRGKVRGWNCVSQGTQTSALVHPREVMRAVLVANGCAFVVAHNHPSGDPAPSAGDMHVTRMVREAAKVLELTFNDHVVVGRAAADPMGRGWFSFREAGTL